MRSRFANRSEAGKLLAQAVMKLRLSNPVVYALPRGGVPVAAQVAEALHAPLDVLFVRKIGLPREPELALGAVVDGDNPVTVWNDDVVEMAGLRLRGWTLCEARSSPRSTGGAGSTAAA